MRGVAASLAVFTSPPLVRIQKREGGLSGAFGRGTGSDGPDGQFLNSRLNRRVREPAGAVSEYDDRYRPASDEFVDAAGAREIELFSQLLLREETFSWISGDCRVSDRRFIRAGPHGWKGQLCLFDRCAPILEVSEGSRWAGDRLLGTAFILAALEWRGVLVLHSGIPPRVPFMPRSRQTAQVLSDGAEKKAKIGGRGMVCGEQG